MVKSKVGDPLEKIRDVLIPYGSVNNTDLWKPSLWNTINRGPSEKSQLWIPKEKYVVPWNHTKPPGHRGLSMRRSQPEK